MQWAWILAYITGKVDQGLLLRNEYLAAENRILRAQIKALREYVRHFHTERITKAKVTSSCFQGLRPLIRSPSSVANDSGVYCTIIIERQREWSADMA